MVVDVTIEWADFADPQFGEFLAQHLRDTEPTAPPESRHALDLTALQAPGIRMWVARIDGPVVGTIALAPVSEGHEEIKSMRTEPALRRRGIGSALLAHAIADAQARGVQRVSLETGSTEFFAPAHALYRKHSFEDCGPFGSYVADEYSIYMTRSLTT